ncbi:629_t:CDS:2 [Entrophospora sp. SA101]|nr:629_t:CDS:2 [Entrophospora sp. SA101]
MYWYLLYIPKIKVVNSGHEIEIKVVNGGHETEINAVHREPFKAGGEIIKQIKDPVIIANVMLVNRTWHKEGRHRLCKDRDEIMEWLRIKKVEKLDTTLYI